MKMFLGDMRVLLLRLRLALGHVFLVSEKPDNLVRTDQAATAEITERCESVVDSNKGRKIFECARLRPARLVLWCFSSQSSFQVAIKQAMKQMLTGFPAH
jgi:hypothetical protein